MRNVDRIMFSASLKSINNYEFSPGLANATLNSFSPSTKVESRRTTALTTKRAKYSKPAKFITTSIFNYILYPLGKGVC